jgi:hypothetical protein
VHVILLRGMYGNLRRRQSENQPAVADIDVRELEHIAQKFAVALGILAVDDGMRASDHDI